MIDARCHLHPCDSLTSLTSSDTDQPSVMIDKKTMEVDNDQDDDCFIEENKRVPTGTRVLINDTNGQVSGQILKNEISYHYSVDFGDDTFSHDM